MVHFEASDQAGEPSEKISRKAGASIASPSKASVQSKLDGIAQRMDELKEALLVKGTLEREHMDLAFQISKQRVAARERERELAMELARVDDELSVSKAKLVGLRSKQSADAAAVLRQATAPVALEMRWAARSTDAAGTYRILSTTAISPQAELLNPGPSEVIGLLETGALVHVVEILRVAQKVRARIQPAGWISLADLEVQKRWAKRHEETRHDWAADLVEDGVASRSASLRAWTVRVQDQQLGLLESMRDTSDIADRNCNPSKAFIQSIKATPAAREFNSRSLSKSVAEKALKVQTEQMKVDRERAGMELAEAESAASSLADKVQVAASRNRTLSAAVSRLDFFVKQQKPANTRGSVFGLLAFWSNKDQKQEDLDLQLLKELCEGSTALLAEVVPTPLEAAPLISEDLAECEQEAAAAQVRIDAMLRTAAELQRQRSERMQEVADLRRGFAPLRAATCNTPSARQLVAAQNRLCHVRQLVAQVAAGAIVEIGAVEAWSQSLQARLAWLLDASGGPPKVKCSWLSESIKRHGDHSSGQAKNGDISTLQSLQSHLERAKRELCHQSAGQRQEDHGETVRNMELVAQQLAEQRMQLYQKHQEEVIFLKDQEVDQQLVQPALAELNLQQEHERQQMERLCAEHEMKLCQATDVLQDASRKERDVVTNFELGPGQNCDYEVDFQDGSPRVTVDELAANLSDALSQFRPCSSNIQDDMPNGARALWWLAANVAALTIYTQVELQDLGREVQDVRTDFYSFADSRWAKERRYGEEWQGTLPKPVPLVPPFSLDHE